MRNIAIICSALIGVRYLLSDYCSSKNCQRMPRRMAS